MPLQIHKRTTQDGKVVRSGSRGHIVVQWKSNLKHIKLNE